MNISYVGKNNEYYDNKRPFAIITYDNNKEENKANSIFDFLNKNGWNPQMEDEMITVSLSNKDEYNVFLDIYKKGKRGSN